MAALSASAGRLIVLEGPDGSGTTTHAARLATSLGSVTTTAEPSSGPIGITVRSMLRSGEVLQPDALQLLFIADRAQHVAHDISPAIERGETVVCDRYIPSTIAYGEALGLDGTWLEACNAQFPKPDVLILLLPPIEVCLQRLRARPSTDALEREETQRKVHAAYTRYAQNHPATIVIDSSGAPDQVAAAVLAAVRAAT